tara:strand:- start:38534 stop:39175 length:642 start_codon:yes stop_codon:yes gene_type:complete
MSEAPKTDHAYDGIEEFDNPLPGWWKWLFIGSIAFSPIYWMFYHGGAEGRSIQDGYDVALAENTRLQFAEMGELVADRDTILRCTTKDNLLKVGKVVFKTNCISCHGRDGEGKVGVNLTDNHYKNVRNIEDIAAVIANGAAGNAMPAWANRLHPNEVVLVSAYVASIRGTFVEGGKSEEGKEIAPWPEPPPEEEAEEESEDDSEKETEKEPAQ